MKKILILTVIAFTLMASPLKAHAGFQLERLIDPLCLFACPDEPEQVINNTTTNTNINSNVNSPDATVIVGASSATIPVIVPTAPIVITTPTYVYDNDYYNHTSPLSATCYRSPTTAGIGDTISWGVSSYGGTGSYYISWSGSEGLSGNGTTINKRYNNPGTKNASVTITSGNQTISRNCESVEIRDYNYHNSDNYNYNYNYNNNYYDNNYYNSPLYVSCAVNTNFVTVGNSVTWQASVSGGNGSYTYNWSGTDSLRGYGRNISTSYSYAGTKTASVTVYSGNQTVTQYCSNSVTVGAPTYPVYNTTFQIACYPSKTSAKIGTPITWTVEAVAPAGSYGNLAYEWSGTEGLYGNQSSVLKTYNSTGAKTANVTVIANNGQRVNQVCNNLVSVSSNTVAKASIASKPAAVNNTNRNNEDISANTFFSMGNVPWGGVSIAVIIVLLATIIAMLFNNKNKI